MKLWVLKPFFMQFNKWTLVSSEKIKKNIWKSFPRVHLLYLQTIQLPGKNLASNKIRIKSTKMQNSNARISKHIKLHAHLPQALQLWFLVLYFNYYRQAIRTPEVQIFLKVLNHCIIQRYFPRMLKICSIADE